MSEDKPQKFETLQKVKDMMLEEAHRYEEKESGVGVFAVEIEKAAKPNPRILDIFLQILEDGRLTDSKGETVYFSESVIIFTSNLGASEVASSGTNEDVAEEFIKIVKNYFDNEIKRPEILGRIGYSNIVPFNFIKDKEFSIKIAKSKLRPVQKAILENKDIFNQITCILFHIKHLILFIVATQLVSLLKI